MARNFWKEVAAEELGIANPRPKDLREALRWRENVVEAMTEMQLRLKGPQLRLLNQVLRRHGVLES